ncbi:hypothetical protein M8312_11890 [Sphingomonas sp. KRR8]|uniref:hypothetical protein n=1 Tax=Sphingomonas sp. KRR8 TaxID=2942996 RepID=UPI002020F0FB|nr:hypothetical protein [Sphingomonas sp. KRR8]URD60477.1 hypothetical protein M8312_11890 [Sphingomonas sp. KRR8]
MAGLAPILLFTLALVSWATSWGWLRAVSVPTEANRVRAARFTGWAFAFVGIACGLLLLTL